jgi:O-antigen ligase
MKDRIWNKNSIPFLIIITGLGLSVLNGSRALTIGFTFSLIFLLHVSKFLLRKKKLFFMGLGILICLSSIVFFKQNSSLGRILIYKISLNIYKEHWFYGIGFNKFKTTYMYYQANYFKENSFTKQDLLLADNTYYVFNDYFQIIIENGILGLLLLLIILFFLIKLFKIVIKKPPNSNLVLICCCLIIIIGTGSFFNYFIYRFEIQIILITSLSVILFYYLPMYKIFLSCLTALLVILVSFHIYNYEFTFFQRRNLTEIKELEKSGYTAEALKLTYHLPPSFKKFHEYYELLS